MIRYHIAFRLGHTLDYGLKALDSGMHGIEIQSCQSYVSRDIYARAASLINEDSTLIFDIRPMDWYTECRPV